MMICALGTAFSRFRSHRFLGGLALVAALGSGPLVAASLEVESSAAFAGDFGLRVTPGCGKPFRLVITGPPVALLPDEVAACTTIAASGIEIVPLGADIRNIGSGHIYSVELSCIHHPADPCLVNQFGQIDFVRWGAVDGLFLGTSGSLKLDDFVSWK